MEPLEAFRTQRWGPRALGEVKEDRVAPFNEDTTRTWPPMSRKITRTLIKDLGLWRREKILEAVRAVHADGEKTGFLSTGTSGSLLWLLASASQIQPCSRIP